MMNLLFDAQSLKGRIARRLLFQAGALLLMTGIAAGWLMQQQLRQTTDASLLKQAQAIAANVEQEPDQLELDLPDGLMLAYESSEAPEYFQLWDHHAQPSAASPSLGSNTLTPDPTIGSIPLFSSVTLPDGRVGRAVTVRFKPTLDTLDEEDESDAEKIAQYESMVSEPVTLVVATSDQAYLTLIQRLWMIIGMALAALMMALIWVLRRSIVSGLDPLRDIGNQMASLDANSLNRRVSPERSVTELAPIVDKTNSMLARLESSFRRERQFNHDVAHELRTPLAELRNLAEVGARWPAEPAMVEQFFNDAVSACSQMDQTLTNLLSLARSEASLEVIEPSPFRTNDAVSQVWSRIVATTRTDANRLVNHIQEDHYLPRGEQQWLLMLQNLMGNAIAHGEPDAQVHMGIDVSGKNHRLWIENPCIDLTAEDVTLVFDRMWRKDTVRAHTNHSGLGLSLVRAYAVQLDLTASASLPSPDIFRVTLDGIEPVKAEPNRAKADKNGGLRLQARPEAA